MLARAAALVGAASPAAADAGAHAQRGQVGADRRMLSVQPSRSTPRRRRSRPPARPLPPDARFGPAVVERSSAQVGQPLRRAVVERCSRQAVQPLRRSDLRRLSRSRPKRPPHRASRSCVASRNEAPPPSPLAGEGVGRRPTDEGSRRKARCFTARLSLQVYTAQVITDRGK